MKERTMQAQDTLFISIKKLVALDIVWHSPKLILTEFLLTVGLTSALAIVNLSFFIRTSTHPLFVLALSVIFFGIALNYLPMVLYALLFARHKNAELEVAVELANKEHYARKYQLQSFLLFVPFAVLILAVIQVGAKKTFQNKEPS